MLAGDEVNLVSLRWSWIAMVRPDDAGTPVATWRVILFAKHDTVSASKGRNSLPIDADDTVRLRPPCFHPFDHNRHRGYPPLAFGLSVVMALSTFWIPGSV